MNKKFIILTVILGLFSFGGTFAFVWFTKKPEQTNPVDVETSQASMQSDTELAAASKKLPNLEPTTKYLTEQQLKNLVQELRSKMQDYDKKFENLKVREQRLQLTQDILKQDIEKLNNLQVELASITANIKSEQEKLIKSRIEITEAETNNFASIAATYDQMDSSSASTIISHMCTVSENEQESARNNTQEDAIKILYYMEDRKKAKLLAELASTKPELAADLSRKLKQIAEVR